MCQ
ncbi:hypothetical protein LINGRAHAP2_LOCUS34380 [Linum grandiflorum]|jgi:hypothetical protein